MFKEFSLKNRPMNWPKTGRKTNYKPSNTLTEAPRNKENEITNKPVSFQYDISTLEFLCVSSFVRVFPVFPHLKTLRNPHPERNLVFYYQIPRWSGFEKNQV